MSVLKEARIEARVAAWAKRVGAETRKLNGVGARSWPDRLFALPGGKTVYIEFKRPGGAPTPGQLQKLGTLRRLGHEAEIFDDADAAIRYLAARMDAT